MSVFIDKECKKFILLTDYIFTKQILLWQGPFLCLPDIFKIGVNLWDPPYNLRHFPIGHKLPMRLLKCVYILENKWCQSGRDFSGRVGSGSFLEPDTDSGFRVSTVVIFYIKLTDLVIEISHNHLKIWLEWSVCLVTLV